jgi:Protein of unknown function (DUF4229)
VKLRGDGSDRGASRAFLVYNLCRLGLLLVCLGIALLAGLPTFAAILVALLVSGGLSWFLLRRQREAMGVAIERTVERSRERLAAKTVAEDAYVDALQEAENSPQPAP